MHELVDLLTSLALVGSFVFIAVGVIWVYQFIQLMLLSESDFPGKHDRYLWAAAFIVASPFAPIAFYAWKIAYFAMRSEQRKPMDDNQRTS